MKTASHEIHSKVLPMQIYYRYQQEDLRFEIAYREQLENIWREIEPFRIVFCYQDGSFTTEN